MVGLKSQEHFEKLKLVSVREVQTGPELKKIDTVYHRYLKRNRHNHSFPLPGSSWRFRRRSLALRPQRKGVRLNSIPNMMPFYP